MPPIPTRTFDTPDVVIRPVRLCDWLDIYRCLREPAMARFVPLETPYRPWHALRFVIRSILGRRRGRRVDFVQVHKDTGRVVGCDMYFRIGPHPPREAEMGGWTARPYWGRHIGREAGDAKLPYLFERVGLHRLVVYMETENVQAIRSIERSRHGWQREGVLRHARWKDGRFRDLCVYSLLKSEPKVQAVLARLRGAPE